VSNARPTYEEFLAAKFAVTEATGFEISADEINPLLKPHQRDIVRWAVRKGRAAIFAAFGLGKSMMQLEIGRIISLRSRGKFLIIAPLGVRQHVKLAADLDAAGRLPVDFMLLPPQSWHADIWTDITRMRTLNGAQSAAGRVMHVCPLQLDLVDRVITQYSMPGEIVADPFAGIGSVPARAIALGRKAWACELSSAYFQDGVSYCRAAEMQASTPTLFDLLAVEHEPQPLEVAGD